MGIEALQHRKETQNYEIHRNHSMAGNSEPKFREWWLMCSRFERLPE